MKPIDYDKLAASAPINADAAMAVSKKGIHYEPKKRIAQLRWEAPPPMRAIPAPAIKFIGDIPGTKFGRLTVIGLLAERSSPDAQAAWVVRCACGAYETRKTKAVRNPKNNEDRCQHCRHLEYIKREYARLGAAPISTNSPP